MIESNISNEALIDEVIKVVMCFTERMNIWETKMYYHNRIANGQFVKEEHFNKFKGLNKDELYEEYRDIVRNTCTVNGRVEGGNPLSASFGKPPAYDGIKEASITKVTLVKSNQIEVVVKGGNLPDQHTKFVLKNENNFYRIEKISKSINGLRWITEYL